MIPATFEVAQEMALRVVRQHYLDFTSDLAL